MYRPVRAVKRKEGTQDGDVGLFPFAENPCRMEQQKVEIPRGAFAAIILTLMVSLMAVAFLLGRQSAQPIAQATPATRAAAPVMAVASPPVAALETPQARPMAIPISRPRPRPRITIQAGDPVTAQPVTQSAPQPMAAVAVQVASVPTAPPSQPHPALQRRTIPPRAT